MEILLKLPDSGYPEEYLISRIMGRRAVLFDDWKTVIFSSNPSGLLSRGQTQGQTRRSYGTITGEDDLESVRRIFSIELEWIYRNMNSRLRDIFRLVFIFYELRNIIICLRYAAGREYERQGMLFSGSILSKEIRDVLLSRREMSWIIGQTENALVKISVRFRGLAEAFRREGIRSAEQRLTAGCLESSMDPGIPPVIRDFFTYLADAGNIMMVYKYFRWDIPGKPDIIRAGTLDYHKLEQALKTREISALNPFVQKLTGLSGFGADDIISGGPEVILLKGLTRKLRRGSRVYSPAGLILLILDYIWRCYLEARNIGIVLYGKDFEREAIFQEAVF